MLTLYRLLAGLIGLFALALQYGLVAQGLSGPALVSWTINFFSFFTIWSNIVVALAMLLPVVAPNSSAGAFLARPSVRTAIAGYIIIVFAVYFFILRLTWDPQGWNKVADQLLHYLTPALFVIDWLLFVPKGQVRWKLIVASLAFPLVYMFWTLGHGAMTNWYPYPFVDVTKLGYSTVLRNMAGLFGVFIAVPLALIVIGRIIPQRGEAA